MNRWLEEYMEAVQQESIDYPPEVQRFIDAFDGTVISHLDVPSDNTDTGLPDECNCMKAEERHDRHGNRECRVCHPELES